MGVISSTTFFAVEEQGAVLIYRLGAQGLAGLATDAAF